MSAPLSVVIPTLNAVRTIGPTLGALVPGASDGLIGDVVLADGGSQDEIAAVADDAGAVLIEAARGRGSQLSAGAKASRGEWLLFLHADTILTGDWIGAIRLHMERHPQKAGYFRLRFDSETMSARCVGGWANWRSALFAWPYGDQGLLISRRHYDEICGYSELPLMEDIAIIRAIGRKRLRCLGPEALTSPERYERDGWIRRGWRNWRCMALYLVGVSPERISKIYQR